MSYPPRNVPVIHGERAVIATRLGNITVDTADVPLVARLNVSVHRRADLVSVDTTCRDTGKRQRLSRVILNPPPDLVVDHINGDPLDNRRENLRAVTQLENRRNAAKTVGATSHFKGVCLPRGRTMWRATIYVAHKARNLGSYHDPIDAAKAYDEAAREIFAHAATLNFPRPGEQSAHRPRARDAIAAQLAKLVAAA